MALDELIKDVIKHFKLDLSVVSLILVNIVTLIFAILQKWDLKTLFYIYCFQTIIFLIFLAIKLILKKKELFVGLLDENYNVMPPTKNTKINTILGFVVGYGAAFGIYFLILSQFLGNLKLTLWIIINIFLCFINHLFSFIYNFRKDKEKAEIVPTLIKNANYRIVVIHFSLWILMMLNNFVLHNKQSSNIIAITVLFVLKTFVDIYTHNREHLTLKDIKKENKEQYKEAIKQQEEFENIDPVTAQKDGFKLIIWQILASIFCFILFILFGFIGALIGAAFYTIIFLITNKKKGKKNESHRKL